VLRLGAGAMAGLDMHSHACVCTCMCVLWCLLFPCALYPILFLRLTSATAIQGEPPDNAGSEVMPVKDSHTRITPVQLRR
jgi:hypothetical protein